jgi:EAL domain-containing protein (putative c-di-GMP-specific phosphodiesterase class I)
MCRMLGIETVAEGVETEAQLDWLRAQDCDEYQGHLCSPALPADQFERRMLELARPA